MTEEMKAAIEEQKRAWNAFQKANDERLARLEHDGKRVAEMETKLERINAALDSNAQVIERVGEVENTLNKLQLGGGGKPSEGNKAFATYMRTGDESEIRAAATVQSDPDGGWLVPDNIRQEIDRVAGETVAMRKLVTPQRISVGTSYIEFVTKSGAASGWVGETDSRPATDTPDLARIETFAHELYANPQASQRLLDDSAVDIEAWLAENVVIEFDEEEGEAFITGNGVNKPFGVLSYPTVANASWVWGKLGFVVTGKAADFADTNPENALVDLVYSLKSRYRNAAAFMMNRTTLGEVRKFKTTMGYLWQPSFQEGEPSRLLGYPVEEDDNMQAHNSAGKFPIAFGNFQAGYRIVDHVMMRVLRDPYSNKPNVGFYTTKRVGGGVRHFEAIKLLKVSA